MNHMVQVFPLNSFLKNRKNGSLTGIRNDHEYIGSHP